MSNAVSGHSGTWDVPGGMLDRAFWAGCTFDGRWREAGAHIEVKEPATGEVIGIVGLSRPGDLAETAAAAHRAQRDWGASPPGDRAAVMRRAAAVLEANHDVLVEVIMRESGAIRGKAETELRGSIDELYHSAALLIAPEGNLLSSADPGRLSFARRVPLGVVGVITPWNFPMLLAMRSVAPAIAVGNAVILKPDPQTPIAGGVAIARAFELAGLPAGVFTLVNGGAEVGEALVEAPSIRMITFTGSTAAGRRVGELAGRALKKVALELGGKSPFIVLDDADIDAAASAGAWGSFLHQGQICMASGRHIVERKVADAYIDALAQKARALPVGDPSRENVAIGPIISARQIARIHSIVEGTVGAGAKIAAGGVHNERYYMPTVITDVSAGMPAYDLEIFGPVAPVIVVEDEAEAVRVANDTEYGLSGAVQTACLDRGLRVARQIRSGMIHLNDQTVHDEAGVPFGGRGASGNGARFGSMTNWEEFTEWQWMTVGGRPARYPF